MITKPQKLWILYYIPTHHSSVLFRSLHYYRPGLIVVTRKMLWQLTCFLLLQQWFSTIFLKEGAKSYDLVREPH